MKNILKTNNHKFELKFWGGNKYKISLKVNLLVFLNWLNKI